ncbi:hypothetical protein AALB53_08905 [Lachnospiraceae bacterium 47-T17]
MTEGKKKLALMLCLSMLLSVCMPVASPAAVFPAVGAAVSKNNAVQVVSTQAKLEKALAKSSVTQIVIKTDKAVHFDIPEGSYTDKKLTVRAPKAEIKNAGIFKAVSIYAISDHSYVENADHNKIRVLALSGRIAVQQGKTVDALTIAKKNSKVGIDVGGTVVQMDVKKESALTMEVTGCIKKMNVNATSTIVMTGNSADTTIIVNKGAKDSRITTSVPATIKLKASAAVILKNGAERAKLVISKSSGKAVSYTLTNHTDAALKLNTSSGTKTLAAGKSYDGKESGSSGTTIMGGSSSGGGTSGGSGSSSGGGTSGGSGSGSGGDTSDGPGSGSGGNTPGGPGGGSGDGSTGGDSGSGSDSGTTTKAKLAVSLQALSFNSFRVYIDTDYDLDDLNVKLTPDVGKIQKVNEMSRWWSDFTYGHVQRYTCYYDFTTEKPLDYKQEYKVSIEKEGYEFDERRLDLSSQLWWLYGPEDEPDYIEVDSQDDEDTMLETAMSHAEEKLSSFYDITIKGYGIGDDKITVNHAYPIDLILEKNGVEIEVEWKPYFVDPNTQEGQWMLLKYDLQYRFWDLYEKETDSAGKIYYNLPDSLHYGDENVNYFYITWESENEDIMHIDGSTGWLGQLEYGKYVTFHLIAHLTNADGTREDTVKVECAEYRRGLATYQVRMEELSDNVLRVTRQKYNDPQEQIEGDISYQWYAANAPRYSDDAKAIDGATGSEYTLQDDGQKGTYWYYCVITNTVGNAKSLSFSPLVRKSFTGEKEDALIKEEKTYSNPKGDGEIIQPGVDFPKFTAQSGLVVFYSYRAAGGNTWWDGLPWEVGTYEIKAYTAGSAVYKEASKTFIVTIEP